MEEDREEDKQDNGETLLFYRRTWSGAEKQKKEKKNLEENGDICGWLYVAEDGQSRIETVRYAQFVMLAKANRVT